jgi:hypothetical protein
MSRPANGPGHFYWMSNLFRNVVCPTIVALARGRIGQAMQSRAEEYRERAKECEQKAAQTRDPEAKEGFNRLARLWDELAEQTEQPSRAGS